MLNKCLFISPKPENSAERIPRILTHELSHLQIEQQIGLIKSTRLPSRFKEGLAVYVAKGGEAETVTEDQAWNAIQVRSPSFDTILKVIRALGLKLHDEAPVVGSTAQQGALADARTSSD